MANFETAIETVLKHEGGYVNDPKDAGGETNFGISKRIYPYLDIKNLTKLQAKAIYLNDFWIPSGVERIDSDKIAEKVFDTGVNIGTVNAIKLLQRACNLVFDARLTGDGVIGSKTLKIVNSIVDVDDFLKVYRSLQEDYYMKIVANNPSQKRFLRGWKKRAAS